MSDQKVKRKLPEWMTKGRTWKKSAGTLKKSDSTKMTSNAWKPVEYCGKIHYLKEFEEINREFELINDRLNSMRATSNEKVPVAFDMEWYYNPVIGVPHKTAVIQICYDLDVCFVIQVFKLAKLPPSFVSFLNNENIILNGLNIAMDIEKLQKDFPSIKADSLIEKCVDLRSFYNEHFNKSTLWSLASLCGQIFNLKMDKSLRISNWEAMPLSSEQQRYAAIDVFIGQKIYHHILEKQKSNQDQYDKMFGQNGDHTTAQRSDDRVQKCDSEEFKYKFGDLSDMSMVEYNGKIHYLTDFYGVAETFDRLNGEINELAMKLENNEKIPVAFDMEWSFDFKNGAGKTAVIQVCFDIGECYVVHISKFQRFPAALSVFLKNEHTVLHGVNIKNDLRKLERDFPSIKADPLIEKCIDLRSYYNNVFNSSEKWSLATLCAHTLRVKMDKSRNVRMSKWDYAQLSKKQLTYAAIDVYVGQRIYHHIRTRERENASKYSGFFDLYGEEIAPSEQSSINLEDDINALMNI